MMKLIDSNTPTPDPALIDTLSVPSSLPIQVACKSPGGVRLTLDETILLYDPINQGVIIFDTQGKLVMLSDQAQRLGIVSSEEDITASGVFGTTVRISPESDTWQKILDGETIRISHSLNNNINCFTFQLEVTLHRLVIRSGAYVIAHLRDQTPMQLLEDQLLEKQELLDLIEELTGVGTSQWDLVEKNIVLCGRYEEILGLNPGEFDGTYESFFRTIHPDDEPGVVQGIQKAEELAYRIIDANGQTRQIISKLRFILEQGRATGILKVSVDVTELLKDVHNPSHS
jgi:PAS domain-containing protein